MKNSVTIIFFFFFHSISYGQIGLDIISLDDSISNQDILCQTYKLCESMESIEPVNQLIKSGIITDYEMIMKLNSYKIFNYSRFNSLYKIDELGNKEVNNDSLLVFLSETDQIIDSANCDWKTQLRHDKYKAVQRIYFECGFQINDSLNNYLKLEEQKKKYRWILPSRDGLALSIGYMRGKDNWIGGECSILSWYDPPYKYIDNCNGEKIEYKSWKEEISSSVNILTFGYYQSFDNQYKDFSLSIYEIINPLVIDLLRVGIQTNNKLDKKKTFFYRPSVGISFGPLSLSYSYNLMFSKVFRENSDQHLFQVRLNYPIIKYK